MKNILFNFFLMIVEPISHKLQICVHSYQ